MSDDDLAAARIRRDITSYAPYASEWWLSGRYRHLRGCPCLVCADWRASLRPAPKLTIVGPKR